MGSKSLGALGIVPMSAYRERATSGRIRRLEMRRSRGTHRAFHRCPLMTSNPIAESKLRDVLALRSSEVRECLEAAREGAELSFEQGLLLATAEGATLEALVAVADAMRRSAIGETITYVVHRKINFTNVCFVGCSFCGFGKGPNAADAYSLSAEDVVAKARDAWEK